MSHQTVETPARSTVVIDWERCDVLIHHLRQWHIPPDTEETSLPNVPRDQLPDFLLAVVAICHQTSPLNREPLQGKIDGRVYKGWDFLIRRFEQSVQEDPELVSPERWKQLSASEIVSLFSDTEFSAYPSAPQRRADLLNDLGEKMLSAGWHSANCMYEFCERRVAKGEPNLLQTLSKFEAYRDPVRKKSFFYLALMSNFGLWRYDDPENLGPPVDYHEIRGHLRIGTVVIEDASLERRVCHGEPVSEDEDILIRSCVFDVICHVTRSLPHLSASQAHYLFWNIFRSVCTVDSPQCHTIVDVRALPERYRPLLRDETCNSQCCPFSAFCKHAGEPKPIPHPAFEGDFH